MQVRGDGIERLKVQVRLEWKRLECLPSNLEVQVANHSRSADGGYLTGLRYFDVNHGRRAILVPLLISFFFGSAQKCQAQAPFGV